MLFPYYYGNHLHEFPVFLQIADLGGPLLVTALVNVMNVGVYLVARQLLRDKRVIQWREPAMAVAITAAAAGYGLYRIAQVDTQILEAEAITVGMPQLNMGMLGKHEDRYRGHRRHIAMSREIEQEASPDLIIWPESAYTFFLREDVTNIKKRVMGPLSTPLLFGGLQWRRVDGRKRYYNTVFMADGDGEILGHYDKTYLLAFGEYLPFADQFPILNEWSPRSGNFTPGDHVRPVPFRDHRISVLVCYEDIIPGFVRKAVREARPHLLVNVTNDAWFGDTTAPWQHLALARFRAIEHHRYLVRSTNSGVSAIIDPVGRVLHHTGVFTTESLTGEVRMLEGSTLYGVLGDWPGYASLAFCLFALWFRKRPFSEPSQ
jgi:apolipoprotein N-acyltransferase